MLAIIIPYYKRTFFEATLQSLASQTCQKFKVYIGDDASPENPIGVLEKYKEQFDFVYHRFATNLGSLSLTKQWERSIALSGTEEWILILGDDDVLGNNVVEAFYDNLIEIEIEKINVVRYATKVINDEGNPVSGIFEHPRLENATDSFWRKFKGETRSSLSEYVFSRSSYSKYGFKDYPLAWHSDDMAWLEFAESQPIISINTVLFYIRKSNTSISGKEDNIESKREASFAFYEDISNAFLPFYDKKKRLRLLSNVENQYFKQKKQKLFFKIIIHHLKHTSLIDLAKFFRRVFINS